MIWKDSAIFGKIWHDAELFDKNDEIRHDLARLCIIWQYLTRFGEIRGHGLMGWPGMGRRGVASACLAFTCMDWALRFLTSLLWSSMVWSGAALSVMVDVGIPDQTGPVHIRQYNTRTKKTTPD